VNPHHPKITQFDPHPAIFGIEARGFREILTSRTVIQLQPLDTSLIGKKPGLRAGGFHQQRTGNDTSLTQDRASRVELALVDQSSGSGPNLRELSPVTPQPGEVHAQSD
jgi:hypothetical protein